MSEVRLPSFRDLLKSRDVEDPLNLWVHRPLAYAMVALVYRTSITPNQITLISMVVGMAGAACWLDGSQAMMVLGGFLVWFSAVIDGADGMLARAKKMSSDLGRVLDGSADGVVALASVIAASYHLWQQHESFLQLGLALTVVVTTVQHVYMYDFYKESFMTMTRADWNGKPERLSDIRQQIDRYRQQGKSFYAFAMRNYLGIILGQTRLVALLNPYGVREGYTFRVTEQSAEDYRRYNIGPMRLWALISIAPHSFLFGLCGALDRLDFYLWLRLVGFNLAYVVVLLWQRQASRRMRVRLLELGLTPVAA